MTQSLFDVQLPCGSNPTRCVCPGVSPLQEHGGERLCATLAEMLCLGLSASWAGGDRSSVSLLLLLPDASTADAQERQVRASVVHTWRRPGSHPETQQGQGPIASFFEPVSAPRVGACAPASISLSPSLAAKPCPSSTGDHDHDHEACWKVAPTQARRLLSRRGKARAIAHRCLVGCCLWGGSLLVTGDRQRCCSSVWTVSALQASVPALGACLQLRHGSELSCS